MTPNQKPEFAEVLGATLSIYRQELTPALLGVYWDDLCNFDLEALKQAFSMHRRNPDNGQFAPKPADIVRLLGGTSKDRAILAWNKVKKAIGSVGSYSSVVFDDALIHAVVSDMGGWTAICQGGEEELVFRQKEFENRYRTYLFHPPVSYPRVLCGVSETENSAAGFPVDPPMTVGCVEQCKLVWKGGATSQKAPVALEKKPNVVQMQLVKTR
ncbi:DUF6475 domain-containing protein [Vibrio metoecus]|uniref:DUF6475 domain-containing protein n=1 Tax=Vibrio metoecus TaxID=1481663 RepID=UPI000BA9B55F|nr:DUF6475 domain-containing protein [Vibrio metoecus]PAR35834.1 hypothetical protein CGT97_09730 [Vibrio metoecus]PAR44094.1 hypothetical protein CGT96_04030 [Vibrio metoecus]